jgi:hypothetical protein
MNRYSPLALLFSATVILAANSLTNADIVKLSEAHISTRTISAKIHYSQNLFDTSAEALVSLAKQGVADEIIHTMVVEEGVRRENAEREQKSQPATKNLVQVRSDCPH